MPKFVHFIYLAPLLTGALISLKSFRFQWPGAYKWFSVFLIGTACMELAAVAWKLQLHQTAYWNFSNSNLWIYNGYFLPEYLFYFFFYSSVLDDTWLKKGRLTFAILHSAFALLNLCIFQGPRQLNTYTIIIGNLVVLGCALLYFRQELLRKVPRNLNADALFWISLGAVLFHTVSLPYFICINYLSRTNLPMAIALFNILLMLNIVLYSCYLTAFLCHNPSPRKHS